MSATFTDDDIGKPVERADGKVIGTVGSLVEGGARVEPSPDAIDQILIRLDRAEPGTAFVLEEDDVSAISETRVHLERGFSRESARSADAGAAAGTGTDESDDTTDGDAEDGADVVVTDEATDDEATDDEAATGQTAESRRSDGGAGSAASANATGDESATGVGPFETTFQVGAAAVSALLALVGLFFFWTGYQDSALPVIGTELNILSGAVGFLLLAFFSVVSLVIAIYMEPGLDH